MIAWSEGVERLAAQSARVELSIPSSDARVANTRIRYGWRSVELTGEPHAFCRGLDLIHDVECLVPFERVAACLPAEVCPGAASVEPTFTGVASHVTSLQAILHGTVEVMTRDAFMVAWYRKRCLDRVLIPSRLPADIIGRIAYLTHHGLRFDLFDLRADLPLPILLMDIRAERQVGQWPAGGAITIPSGGFTPMEALRHALTLACTRFAGIGLDNSPEKSPLDTAAVEALGQTAPFWPPIARYLNPNVTKSLEFFRGVAVQPLRALNIDAPYSPRGRFEALRSWFTAARLNWVAVPLVNDDVVEAGLRVARVVVPEAVRMTLRSDEVDRQQPRFWSNWPGTSDGSWNDDPHPVY